MVANCFAAKCSGALESAAHRCGRFEMLCRIMTKESAICATIFVWLLYTLNLPNLENFDDVIARNSFLLSGGFASGALHALTGPDHFVSILPHILGQRYWRGFRVGCAWGTGHGLTTCFIGGAAYILKGTLLNFGFLDMLAKVNNFAVGMTFILIGLMGLHESAQYQNIHLKNDDHRYMHKSDFMYLTIFLNGVFLGCSWDGLPSLGPALTATNTESMFAFLTGNFIGTILGIGFFSGVMAGGSSFLIRISQEALVPKMCAATSATAITMGIITMVSAICKTASFSLLSSCGLLLLLCFAAVSVILHISSADGSILSGSMEQWYNKINRYWCSDEFSVPLFRFRVKSRLNDRFIV